MTPRWHILQFWASVLVFLVVFGTEVRGVRHDDLYQFGDQVGDLELHKGDNSYANVTFTTPINLFGETYNTVYVSTNGLVTFLTPLESFINVQFPLNIPAIAPLYANADTSRKGSVYYRESDAEEDLMKSLTTLRRLFPNLSHDYQPVGVFIVTWNDIGMFGDLTNERGNTFQLAITTDGQTTFVEFLYPDGGIEWIQAPNTDESLPSVRAQAGIVSPSGKLFTLKGSGSHQVIYLDKWTNAGNPGQFVYKIGNVDEDGSGIVEQPNIYEPEQGDSQAKSCSEGYSGCHSNAQCSDSPSGVCCTCRQTYIGNGISCLKEDVSIRVTGRLSLNVNGIRLEGLLFEGYIVVKDGRVYAAVDGLPPSLGPAMQFLKPLESIPGWLFAVTSDDNVKNGFQLTGGVLNQTASVTYSPQHVIRIRQVYQGADAFDQIRVDVDVSGRMPEYSLDLGLKHPEYEEIYTKTGPGEYRSTNTHKYQLNSGETKDVEVDQTIQFKENCHSEQETTPQRIVSNRNYITYKEPILRIAGFHRLGGGPVLQDPCIEGKAQCVANSSCLVDGDSFKCVCNNGFQSEYYGEELGCIDINECQERTNNCHEDAICINEIGSYSCNCNSGFTGDGIQCQSAKEDGGGQYQIPGSQPSHMDCQDFSDPGTCVCDQGFEIQSENNDFGIACVDIDECSRASQICSTYAECINFEGGFECRCHEGFRGDGQECEPAGCDTINCPAGSVCEESSGSPQCVCPPGFVGSPPSCQPYRNYDPPEPPPRPYEPRATPEPNTDHCTTDSDCPQFARCAAGLYLGVFTCVCEDGSSPSSTGRCPVRSSPVRTSDPSSADTIFRTCFEQKCWCPPGYIENDNICVKDDREDPVLPLLYIPPIEPEVPVESPELPDPTTPPVEEEDPTSCRVVNNCHHHASCIPMESYNDGYRCMCNPGYDGDGFTCTETDLSCSETNICHTNAVCMPDGDQSTKNVCICSEGFVGDGYNCFPSGQCSDDTDCGDYGVCEYNDEKESYECGCRKGYQFDVDGRTCIPEKQPVLCSDCDPNASCVQREGVNVCQCNDGYRGDGISCVEYNPGCDILHNCHDDAQCIYTPEHEGYRCKCNEGFEGNGLVCELIITCYYEPSMCNENARCVQMDNKFTCKCNENFFGNGTVCKAAADQKEEFLLLTKGGAVMRIPFTQDSPGFPINIEESQVAVGITTDCVEGKVYWSDLSRNTIRRAKYDGSEAEEFLKTSGQAEGLAMDWIQRQIYWTDSAKKTISTANLDTREVKVIIDKNLVNPRGVAVHPYRRKLYWSDWNRKGPKIEESDLDGSQRRVIVSGNNVKLPNALTIDWDRDELCWSNAGTKTIDCMYLHTGLPQTVVNNANYPFGVAVSADRYYWTDWTSSKIMSAPKGRGSPITSIDIPLGNDKPFGLAAVAPCPR
ncbi:hypothetical protein GE061_016234 [Apolygus lucorum]|uniref:Nidogen n=1 Tax=Apolygus lucorum TaxID=248454 RepID=A0A8S9XI96_APOLU|nr:hypothetical protein GE061_016234 [Apolygus lucorum]